MEFLLINHPLDCPICDQGGECELQDISMGYGRSVTRFVERKRVVADENLGPLVATEMTRCIHCTRCVRVLGEIAGTHELGDMNRNDRHVVGTYIGRTIESELSGNVIDVCPVGALTDKVYRFKARAWEMIAKPSIGYHDALGSNLWLHSIRSHVLRVVPRDNEAINECWLADRDRYSHEGLYTEDRAQKPMIRRQGTLVEVPWDEAIAFVADGLKQAGSDVAALLAPMTSCEEGWLLTGLLRGLGSGRIDHRLRVQDFSDGGPPGDPFEMPVEAVARVSAALLVGGNPRHEMPLLNHRLRYASRHDSSRHPAANPAHYDISSVNGAAVHVLNPLHFDYNFELASETIAPPWQLIGALAALAKATGVAGDSLPRLVAELVAAAELDDATRAVVKSLREAASSVVLLGEVAAQHPDAARLRTLARAIAAATGSAYDELPSGANAIGLARVGAQSPDADSNARAILETPPRALVTWQAEALDSCTPAVWEKACSDAGFHVHAGAYVNESILATADAILPLALPPETDGTWVNVDGCVQSLDAGAAAPGEARAGWKVLRALGGALDVEGFGFTAIGEVRAGMEDLSRARTWDQAPARPWAGQAPAAGTLVRVATVGIYRTDAVVRRAKALQAHPLNRGAALRICADDADALGLLDGARADVDGVQLPVVIDASVPKGCAWIEAGHPGTESLPPGGGTLAIKAGNTR
jgi:NADH-quinone oxidoreductase subunit G